MGKTKTGPQEDAYDSLFRPNAENIKQAREAYEKYIKLKLALTQKKIKKNKQFDIEWEPEMKDAIWDINKLPKCDLDAYETNIQPITPKYHSALVEGFCDNSITEAGIKIFEHEFIDKYIATFEKNSNTFNKNKTAVNDFFDNLKTNLGYIAPDGGAENDCKSPVGFAAHICDILADIEEEEIVIKKHIDNYNKSIAVFEKTLYPEPKLKIETDEIKAKSPKKEVSREKAPTEWNYHKIPKLIKDSWGLMFDNISERIKIALTSPVPWLSFIIFIFDCFLYLNIFWRPAKSYLLLLVMITVVFSSVGAILPYFLAKQLNMNKRLYFAGNIALAAVMMGYASLSSYIDRARFKNGNSIFLSIFVAVLPFILGVVLTGAWHSRIKQEMKNPNRKNKINRINLNRQAGMPKIIKFQKKRRINLNEGNHRKEKI